MPHPALRLSDRQLLAECEVQTYRAKGPGGQKKDKVESAVRIRHGPTGVSAIAEESRSQAKNRIRALRRLREAIALEVRSAIDSGDRHESIQLTAAMKGAARLRVSVRNPQFPLIVATTLDVLSACSGRMRDAARLLRVSTHELNRFFSAHPRVWQRANRIRADYGHRSLRAR